MDPRPAADLRGPLIPRIAPRFWLWSEFALLYVAVPVLLWFERHSFARLVVPTLLALAVVFTVILLRDPAFDRRRFWNAEGLGRGLRRMLRVLLPSTAVLALLTWWLEPELFLRLPRERPGFWPVIMLAYPVLSVYPQELIFRTFLFHRYRGILPGPHAPVIASALAFGLAHLFFANWIAPVLSTAGGWLFARTYARSASTLQASIEHGLWGDVIFTIGLGWYFYGGSVTG